MTGYFQEAEGIYQVLEPYRPVCYKTITGMMHQAPNIIEFKNTDIQ